MKVKKKAFFIMFLLIISIFMGSSYVFAEDLYYMPNKGESYLKSEHVYSWHTPEGDSRHNYRAIVHTLVRGDIDTSEFESSADFTERFSVPWGLTDEEYFLVYCADINIPALELEQYRKVPIENATYIDDNVKSNIIGMLKSSWPYLSLDKAISNLVEAKVLEAKEVNGEVYYTSPLNLTPTKSITEHEFVSALQMAIFYYTNPNQVNNIYDSTLTLNSKTVLSPTKPFNNPWEVDDLEDGTIDEVKNNITALYNYFISQKGVEENFKIESANIEFKNKNFVVTIKTNRDFNEKDEIALNLSRDSEEIGTYKLTDLTKEGDSTYSLTVDNKGKKDLTLSYSGKEFVDLKTYVFEAVGGKEQSQTFLGISSTYLPVNGKLQVIIPPSTNSFVSIVIVLILGICLFGIVYFNKMKKYYN